MNKSSAIIGAIIGVAITMVFNQYRASRFEGLQEVKKHLQGNDQVLLILSKDTAVITKDTIIVHTYKPKQ